MMPPKFAIAGLALLVTGAAGTAVLISTRVVEADASLIAWKCVNSAGGWSWSDTATGCPSGTSATRYVVPDACDVGQCIACPTCTDSDPQTISLLCCEPISGELNCYQVEYMSQCANDWILAECHFGQTNSDGTETCFY